MSPTPPSNSTDQRKRQTTRRGFLGSAALLAGAAFTGCLGSGPSSPTPEPIADLPASVADPRFVRTREDDWFRLQFKWFNAIEWNVAFDVPVAEYESRVTATRSLAAVFDDALACENCRSLAASIGRAIDDAGVTDPLNRVRVATSFVRALQYVPDDEATGSKEYPRFAVETVVENKGDCEDFAVVFAGIFGSPVFDLDPKLVILPGHTGIGLSAKALGIEGSGDPDAESDGVESGLPTLTVDGEELLYIDPTYPVGLGIVPEPYREYGVVATYDGDWRIEDHQALATHIRRSVLGEGISDPSKYF